jgi:phenylacetate-CoA oxygenase PaaH subunit
MSKLREMLHPPRPEGELPPEPEMRIYEVFIQVRQGEPHEHAGSLDAVDLDHALALAMQHYGRDQACQHVWVADRTAMKGSDSTGETVFRVIDQDYRFARGYLDVRHKWEQFRKKKEVDEYQKEDIHEHF